MATNAFTAFVQGQQAGQQARAYQQQQEDRNALRTLAPQILAGDPGAFNQAAAIDPRAATAVQDAGDGQARRLRGALDYFGQALETGDDRVIQARFKEISPFLSRVTGNEAPPAWTEEMRPAFEQAKQRVAMAPAAGGATGNNIQSTYVDAEGNRVAIFRDGTSRVLGANNQSIRVLEPEGSVPYGVVTSGGRAGQMVGIGGGQAQPQGAQASPQQDEQAAQRAQSYYQRMRAIGFTDEQAVAATDALLADMGYQQGQPESAPAASASNGPPPSAGRLLVPDPVNGGLQPPRTPTAAEKAAASEAAKLGVQLEYAPQMAAAAAEAARAKKLAEAGAESEAQAPKRIASYRQALQAAANVETSINRALEMVSPMSTGFLGARTRGFEGYPAYDLAAEIETVRANLGFDRLQQMRDNSPTGGALGQVAIQELVALQSTIANLDPNQSAEQLTANLRRVQQHYANWRSAVEQALADEQRGGGQQQASDNGLSRVQSAADYQALPPGAEYIAPDGSLRRKR